MKAYGFQFIRYIDDILIFFNKEKEGRDILAKMASILDKQQRLMLQRHKTKIYSSEEFKAMCTTMIEDRPISKEEEVILKVIKKYSGNDPYRTVSYNDISKEDWERITNDVINKIISEYISKPEIDYIRLRWFYRRLAQIGHPGAIEISLAEIARLAPCFANICFYFSSIQSIDEKRWKYIGEKLLELINSDEVQNNEFFKLSILSLFTKNKYINHFSVLANKYSMSEDFAKREILLSADQNLAYDWLREKKENYQNMDPWQKMAFIYSISGLPKDEKKYFINKQSFCRPFDIALSNWTKNS